MIQRAFVCIARVCFPKSSKVTIILHVKKHSNMPVSCSHYLPFNFCLYERHSSPNALKVGWDSFHNREHFFSPKTKSPTLWGKGELLLKRLSNERQTTLHIQPLETHLQAFRKDEASSMRRVVLDNWPEVPGYLMRSVWTKTLRLCLPGTKGDSPWRPPASAQVLHMPNPQIEPPDLTLGRDIGRHLLTSQRTQATSH